MSKKILVVEDEADILKAVSFRLDKAGYEVLTAMNGQTALDLVRKDPPDLVLLDLRLPILSGYEVCKQIKSDEKLKKVKVIFFTASVVHNIVEKTKEFGADDYLIKPFSPNELMQKIEKFLG